MIGPIVETVAELERGRESYANEAWLDAYESLGEGPSWAAKRPGHP